MQQLLRAEREPGRAAGGEGDGLVHRGARGGAVVAHRGAGEQEGRQRIARVLLQRRSGGRAQIGGVAPLRSGGAGHAQRARGRRPKARQLGRRRAGLVGGPAVAADQRDPEARSFRPAPAREELVLAGGEAQRRRLGARALAGIGHARHRHLSVHAHFQRRGAFDPDQVVAALQKRDFARGVEDVAFGRLDLEAYVAVGEVEGAIVDGCGCRHRPVERQGFAQIEEAQRREGPADAPVLHGAHFAPGVGFQLRVARSLRPTQRNPRRRLAQQPRRAGRQRSARRCRCCQDGRVHLGRLALEIEEPRRRQLDDGFQWRQLQRRDEGLHGLERIGAIFRQLAQPTEGQRPIGWGACDGCVGEPAGGAAGIRRHQVAQPAGPRLLRGIAVGRGFGGVEPGERVVGDAVGRRVLVRAERAASEQEGNERPQSGLQRKSPAEAVCVAGAAVTRRCSASSRRPRKARKAP